MTLRILRAAAVAAALLAPVAAAAYPGENEVIKGRYFESRGEIDTAAGIYAGVVARASSPRAVRAAVQRLVLIERARGDVAAEMAWIEALVRNGDINKLSELARRSTESGRLPPSFRDMAATWESGAESQPSVGIAMFMAERAEAGDLAGTAVRNKDAAHWYGLAMARGSDGAASKLIARAIAGGRIDEALALMQRLGPGRSTDEIVSIAKSLARGSDGLARDRARAATLLARVPDREANRIAGMLMREASAAGDVEGALFWLDRAGPSPDGLVPTLARLYGKTDDPATRATLLGALERQAAAGNPEAAAAAGRILLRQGKPPSPDLVHIMLSAREGGLPATVDRVAGIVARMPPGDPATAAVVAALSGAADGGDAAAMTILARLYATGGPVAVDPAASRSFAERAADAGSAEAQYRLGVGLAMAGGAEADRGLALLARAADGGYAPARAALAALVTTTGATP